MDRKISPPIKDAVEFNLRLKPYDHYLLDNGIPVYEINAGAQEVLQIELVFYAGNFYEEQNGIAAATNHMLKNGTTSRTAFQINEDFEYYGAYCTRACYNETAVISLHTLSRHLQKLMPVVEDMITNSIFPEEELGIYKQNTKQWLQVNMLKCEFVAGRLIDNCLYGDAHPYAKNVTPADLDTLNTDDLKKFYTNYYLNGYCVVFAAGKLPADLKNTLNNFLGKLSLKKPTFVLPPIDPKPAVEKKYRIQNDSKAVQGAIRIAQNFPNRHHPDFKKVIVLNNVFGGFFGSRLMNNIREEKGYTYGIYSYLQNHIQQSAWIISTEAGKDVCEATIEEVYKEMSRLRDKKVGKVELMLVKNYMMGQILGDLDGPFHIMAKWKNIILNNLDEQYFYDSVEEIKNITSKELKLLANKYLQPENFYELVVY